MGGGGIGGLVFRVMWGVGDIVGTWDRKDALRRDSLSQTFSLRVGEYHDPAFWFLLSDLHPKPKGFGV